MKKQLLRRIACFTLLIVSATFSQANWTFRDLNPDDAYSSEINWGERGLQLGSVTFTPGGDPFPCLWEDSALTYRLISKEPGVAKSFSNYGPIGGRLVKGEFQAGFWAPEGTGYQFVDLHPGSSSSFINSALGNYMVGRATNNELSNAAIWANNYLIGLEKVESEMNSIIQDFAGFGTIFIGNRNWEDLGYSNLATLWYQDGGIEYVRAFRPVNPYHIASGANGAWYSTVGTGNPIRIAGFLVDRKDGCRHAMYMRVNNQITSASQVLVYNSLYPLRPGIEESEAITGARDVVLGKYRRVRDSVPKSCLWGFLGILGQVTFLDDYLPADYIGSEFRAIVLDELNNLAIYGVGYKQKGYEIVPEALAMYYKP